MNWLRRHPNAIAYALIVAMAAAGSWAQDNEAETRTKALAHESEERRAALCETLNDAQDVVRDLVDVTLEDSGGGRLPLTALPEFQALDPATQDYLAALEALSSSDDPNDIDVRLRRFAEQRLVPADCDPA